jgi:hypothetical protein
MAVDGDDTALASIAEPGAVYWLMHPDQGRWQVARDPAVTQIRVWGLGPDRGRRGSVWPAVEEVTSRALGEGDWQPSLLWVDVIGLLSEPCAHSLWDGRSRCARGCDVA